jgi:hypothetical protein
MNSKEKQTRSLANWPPEKGEIISFTSSTGLEKAILHEVRWGLVWRDFFLEDGRVIPEHRISGCPQPQVWRKIDEVTQAEREECEQRLLSMAGAGMDPRQRDQPFWTELNQYLAYTYLRYKPPGSKTPEAGGANTARPDTVDENTADPERANRNTAGPQTVGPDRAGPEREP